MDVNDDKFLIENSMLLIASFQFFFQIASYDYIILSLSYTANISATKVFNAFNIMRLDSLCAFILPRLDYVQLVLGRSQRTQRP